MPSLREVMKLILNKRLHSFGVEDKGYFKVEGNKTGEDTIVAQVSFLNTLCS